MKSAGTYKITRQGQITIPQIIRKEMNLEEGDVLDFFYSPGIVVLKRKSEPVEVFRALAEKTRKRFKEKGISKEEVAKAIKGVRKDAV